MCKYEDDVRNTPMPPFDQKEYERFLEDSKDFFPELPRPEAFQEWLEGHRFDEREHRWSARLRQLGIPWIDEDRFHEWLCEHNEYVLEAYAKSLRIEDQRRAWCEEQDRLQAEAVSRDEIDDREPPMGSSGPCDEVPWMWSSDDEGGAQ